MAISEKDKARVQAILNAEWANFQNFAIAYTLLQKRKKWAENEYANFKAKKPSKFKYHADYNAFVTNHNKLNAKWLSLKNAYTERQRQLRVLNSPYLKEASDEFTKNSVKIYNESSALNGLGVAPLVVVLVCIAIASLSSSIISKFFSTESSVLKDYKELTALTQEVSKTDPTLAAEILKNYQGVAYQQIKQETDNTVSAQLGKGLKTGVIILALGVTGYGLYKYTQNNSKPRR